MKNENVHMQALHHKLVVVLVQILPYNCSETDYSYCEDSPPAKLCPLPRRGFQPQTPLALHYFFSLRHPDTNYGNRKIIITLSYCKISLHITIC